MAQTTSLPTIWTVPDELWEHVAALLTQYDPPCKTGRKRMDARLALNGIIYRARTGCQWNQLPREFGDDASVHRTLQRWEKLELFDKLWALLLRRCDYLGGVEWDWQAADGCLSKARGVSKKGRKKTPVSAPTPRIVVSKGSKRA